MGDKSYNEKQTNQTQYLNQVYTDRIVRAEFDKNWKSEIRDEYIIYTALIDYAKIIVILTDDSQRLIMAKRGGQVWVGDSGVTHFTKPHIVRII